MYKSINVRGRPISVHFEHNFIHILCDENLESVVKGMPATMTDELVLSVKNFYYNIFKKDFLVTDKSLAVEIWGHVFADRFAVALKKMIKFKPVQSLADKISARCKVINIGEKGHDSNRFVWDMLAPFKSIIAALLLKNG